MSKKPELNYFQKVFEQVAKIPKGKVASYSQIAAMVSTPRAARVAGFALKHLPKTSKIPWHRVINAKGFISIENLVVSKEEQARRLQQEGVEVKLEDGNYRIELDKYLWRFRE